MKETLVRESGICQWRDVSKRQNETIELNFINVTRWQNDLCAQDYEKRTLASNAKLAQTEVEVIRTL